MTEIKKTAVKKSITKKPVAKKPIKKVVKKPTKKVVTISRAEILDSDNVAMTIEKKLKAAGIPIVGGIFLDRVSSGTLISKEDYAKDCYVYEWKPE